MSVSGIQFLPVGTVPNASGSMPINAGTYTGQQQVTSGGQGTVPQELQPYMMMLLQGLMAYMQQALQLFYSVMTGGQGQAAAAGQQQGAVPPYAQSVNPYAQQGAYGQPPYGQGYSPYAQQGVNPYAAQQGAAGYNPYAPQGTNPMVQGMMGPMGQMMGQDPMMMLMMLLQMLMQMSGGQLGSALAGGGAASGSAGGGGGGGGAGSGAGSGTAGGTTSGSGATSGSGSTSGSGAILPDEETSVTDVTVEEGSEAAFTSGFTNPLPEDSDLYSIVNYLQAGSFDPEGIRFGNRSRIERMVDDDAASTTDLIDIRDRVLELDAEQLDISDYDAINNYLINDLDLGSIGDGNFYNDNNTPMLDTDDDGVTIINPDYIDQFDDEEELYEALMTGLVNTFNSQVRGINDELGVQADTEITDEEIDRLASAQEAYNDAMDVLEDPDATEEERSDALKTIAQATTEFEEVIPDYRDYDDEDDFEDIIETTGDALEDDRVDEEYLRAHLVRSHINARSALLEEETGIVRADLEGAADDATTEKGRNDEISGEIDHLQDEIIDADPDDTGELLDELDDKSDAKKELFEREADEQDDSNNIMDDAALN